MNGEHARRRGLKPSTPSRARRRSDLVWAAGVLAVVLVLGYVLVTVHTLSIQRDALVEQVRSLGGTPVVGARGERGDPGPTSTVPGPQGPAGAPGSAGAPGPVSTIPGPSGPPGPIGPSSTVPGPAGAPGADSTVPGPVGPVGSPGTAGQAGQAGQDGKDGKDGRDGQTCPDGYRLETDPNDPDSLVCRRINPEPSPSASPSSEAGSGSSPGSSETVPVIPALLAALFRGE
jgi:hypothetical protein